MLNALNVITHVNVISTPTLTVLDNKTATLQVGDQVPITTQSATSVASIGAPVVNSVNYGLPTSASGMRTLDIVMRFRF